MTTYYLCLACRRAWLAPVAAACCGSTPLACRPGTADARAWLTARLSGERAAQVTQVAAFREKWEHVDSIRRGVERRGRTWTVAA